MSHWRNRVGIGLAAALLSSVLATSVVATALAMTNPVNANPSVVAPYGVPTNVGIQYVWNGTGPADAIGVVGQTTFAITLPAGYYWSALPTFSPNVGSTITFGGPSVSNGGLTETWTLSGFSVTTPWSLTLAGGTVVATGAAGSGPITLKVGTATPVQVASLTSSINAGTAVPFTVSPLAVPADGTSTILLTFGLPTAACASAGSFTVGTSAGTFVATGLTLVAPSVVGGASVTASCASAGLVQGKTLTLRAPTMAGTATVTVKLAGATAADSTATVTFTSTAVKPGPVAPGAKKLGAGKVRFYGGSATAGGCASSAATPAAGAATFGFAVVNVTGSHKLNLNVEVSLKGALPNATYAIAVQQAPGSCSTAVNIRTNARGNANRHFHLTLSGAATQVWVTATSGASVLVTPAVTVAAKHHDPRGKGNANGKDNGTGHDQED